MCHRLSRRGNNRSFTEKLIKGLLLFPSPVLPEPEVIRVTSPSGVTEANCTARSRPAAEIMWEVGGGSGGNRTLGPPVWSADVQGDGTTVVTSTLLFQPGSLGRLSVKCVVRHRGLRTPLTVSLDADGEEPGSPGSCLAK